MLYSTICWTVTANHGAWATERPEIQGGNATADAQLSSGNNGFGVHKTSDIRFCDHLPGQAESEHTCDVYVPLSSTDTSPKVTPSADAPAAGAPPVGAPKATADVAERRWPVILLVHGGGWATGSKWTMDRHARQLAKKGFAAVSINYRLAPSSKFPDQVDDVRSALVWITENAKSYGFDTDRVGLYGYSAGGHLVSLVATLADEPWETVRQTTSWEQHDARWEKLPRIRAVCIGGPPTDFRGIPLDNTSLSFFLGGSRRERPDVYTAASPICFTSPTDPPFQIIHGEADGIVSVENAKEFHLALVKSNVSSSLHTLPGKGHLLAFISPKLTDWMLGFFEEQLLK